MENIGLSAQALYGDRISVIAKEAFNTLWNVPSSNAENSLAHELLNLSKEFFLLNLPLATWDRRAVLVKWCDNVLAGERSDTISTTLGC